MAAKVKLPARFWITLNCGHRRTVSQAEYDARAMVKCGRCSQSSGRTVNRRLNKSGATPGKRYFK